MKKDTVGGKNPYRYRGYRYDTETGLYYLNSTYYNPDWGRFINADSIAGSTGELLNHNVFAYCANNPIIRADESGYFWNIIIGAAVGAGFSIASQLLSGTSIDHINWKDVGISAAAGALSAIPGVGLLGSALISGGANAASDIASGDASISKVGADFGIGFVVGLGTGAFGEGIGKVADKEAVDELSSLSRTKIKARIRKTGIELPKEMSINECKVPSGYRTIKGLGAALLGNNRRTFISSFYGGLANCAHSALKSCGLMPY